MGRSWIDRAELKEDNKMIIRGWIEYALPVWRRSRSIADMRWNAFGACSRLSSKALEM